MEFSPEVYSILDRIKKIQLSESSEIAIGEGSCLNLNNTKLQNANTSHDDVTFNYDELIPVDDMDFSDDERWLCESENSKPFTGDLQQWLRQSIPKFNNPMDYESPSKKSIDTRTFTRPKKRLTRPSLEQYFDARDSFTEDAMQEQQPAVNFKLNEPFNSTFDRILAQESDCIDSFQNMSPPSLMNSLCSSTFTNLMDSGYNQVPSTDSFIMNESYSENADPNIIIHSSPEKPYDIDNKISIAENNAFDQNELNKTFTPTDPAKNRGFEKPPSKLNITFDHVNYPTDNTYDMKSLNTTIEQLNSTFSKTPSIELLNTTYHKNISNFNLAGTNTITKKTSQLKASCPDINRTFKGQNEYSINQSFEKLSDSQPNLTEDLKRTILNQSMELMQPYNNRSGSADSLDERSSSISNSSKDSGTKIVNNGELEHMTKIQDQCLHHVMSTPQAVKSRLMLWDGDGLSPIQTRLMEDSDDSDISDTCHSTASTRSGFSRRRALQNKLMQPQLPQQRSLESIIPPNRNANITRTVEVSQSDRIPPTMIVKPMETKRKMVQPTRSQISSAPALVRPRLRTSGLPRPTVPTTGIPRPTSRIPAPKTFRAPVNRQQHSTKSDWMDGCY